MNIVLKKLSLENFKGSGKNTLNFSNETNIYGANGTGKTTLVDAFTWLLFGKDSTDRKDFSIKPLDYLGKSSEKLEIEVEAIIEIDGANTEIKRNFREKWVKKRGEEEAEFAGNETVFSWNEIPLSQKEFQEKIASIMSENLFKIVTNPLYFNGLKWQDKRQILINMVGGVSDAELANTNKYLSLLNTLNAGKTIEEYKKELASKTKKIRDEMKVIPSRIDEASKSIKEIKVSDFEVLILGKTNMLANIDEQINNSSKALKAEQETIKELTQKGYNIENSMLKIEYYVKANLEKTSRDREELIKGLHEIYQSKNRSINKFRGDINERNRQIEQIEKEVISLRVDFAAIAKKELAFDEDSFVCPTCKRIHETDDIERQKEEMLENFNGDKAKKLQEIREKGKAKNAQADHLRRSNETDELSIQELENARELANDKLLDLNKEKISYEQKDRTFELEEALAKSEEYQKAKSELEKVKEAIANRPTVEEANQELFNEKDEVLKQLDELKEYRVQKAFNGVQEKRIEELKSEMKAMSSELNTLEKMEFLIQEFTKDKISLLESKVNEKFEFVNFKMFETQVNGGEVETCEILVNGVPFNDANTAGKIQAGIDIINTLSEHYQIFAPIWIDNRESVTAIQPTRSQIINLFVSPEHKQLTIHE